MPINKDNIDFLFDIMKFYDEQYDNIADNCFSEIYRALNEICENSLRFQNITILPVGSYAIKSNYQVFEPIEFYCIMQSNRDILLKESEQKKVKKNKTNTIKDIYAGILGKNEKELTSFDVARTIMQEMQKYIADGDKVYFKNNVVFLKIKMQDEDNTIISVIIHVVYDFENSGTLEFSKLGHKYSENTINLMQNIQHKNLNTNGNYLLLCKLLKMLELELILNNQSNYCLSQKTLFVERLLYKIPDKFYIGEDFCEMFRSIVNYLKHTEINDILLADGTNNRMFKANGYYENKHFKSFVKKITYLYENTDKLIEEAINNENKEFDKNNTMQNNNDELSKDNLK